MENKMKFWSLWLCLICISVFIVQLIIPGFTDIFMLTQNAAYMPWQFLTAIFLHGGIAHLMYNLFALFLFGFILEKLVGSKNFLVLFLVSGVLANFIAFFWYPNSLGASGAIMAIIGTLAVLRPMMVVWSFNLPMPMFVLALIWVGGSVLGIFGFGDQGTGHIAHLSGIVVGIAYGFFLRLKHSGNPVSEESDEIELSEEGIREWEDTHIRS